MGETEEAVADPAQEAQRARWIAVATGALLALAGLAASTLRVSGSAPALVPAAYAFGAVVCALASVLGSRGRTRRALWLLIAGVMVMALGDQFD
jgi:cytochrome bd-type quinol oxidase subunit 2